MNDFILITGLGAVAVSGIVALTLIIDPGLYCRLFGHKPETERRLIDEMYTKYPGRKTTYLHPVRFYCRRCGRRL